MADTKDINKATPEELQRAFQVNEERAQALIEKREELGGFKSWEDVKQVPGISEGMIQNLQEAGFTVGGAGKEGGQEKAA